ARLDGTIDVAGLHQPVEIVRDTDGIPHIYAANEADAYFALGFVHAQDRLFQMEMQRRVGAGRLAEAIGPAGLSTDRFMRLLGIHRLVEGDFAALAPET